MIKNPFVLSAQSRSVINCTIFLKKSLKQNKNSRKMNCSRFRSLHSARSSPTPQKVSRVSSPHAVPLHRAQVIRSCYSFGYSMPTRLKKSFVLDLVICSVVRSLFASFVHILLHPRTYTQPRTQSNRKSWCKLVHTTQRCSAPHPHRRRGCPISEKPHRTKLLLFSFSYSQSITKRDGG